MPQYRRKMNWMNLIRPAPATAIERDNDGGAVPHATSVKASAAVDLMRDSLTSGHVSARR